MANRHNAFNLIAHKELTIPFVLYVCTAQKGRHITLSRQLIDLVQSKRKIWKCVPISCWTPRPASSQVREAAQEKNFWHGLQICIARRFAQS